MRITEPQGPFLCPSCAQRRQASLRYCDGDAHALLPECPEHHQPLRWTNGGLEAHCNQPTGRDSRGRRSWCQTQRTIVRYDAVGLPLPTVERPVRTIGRSVRRPIGSGCLTRMSAADSWRPQQLPDAPSLAAPRLGRSGGVNPSGDSPQA